MISQTLSHYRILEKLGQGGMGVVYRAEDTTLGRQVAIKVLPEAFVGDPERMARFEREAKLLASLSHQNIASIFGLEEAEGKRFIVMELAEGETLAKVISLRPLPVDETLQVCRQIAEGPYWSDPALLNTSGPSNTLMADGSILYLQSLAPTTGGYFRVAKGWLDSVRKMMR